MYATLRCMDDYRDVNLASWDERAAAHAASPDYAVSRFIDDPSFLSEVVSFDLPRLGDIAGLDAVHLQCHIGTDTVSLARLGARVTGLDFSPAALEQGRRLAAAVGLACRVRRVRSLRRARGTRDGALRPRLHRRRSALLVARHPPLGRGRPRPPAAGRKALHPRGAPRAVGARGHAGRRPAGARIPVFRAGGGDGLGRGRDLRRDRSGLHAQRDARVEPRPRRDRLRPVRRRDSSSRCSRSTTRSRGTHSPAR